jgi:5-methylcytosine-specific restriction endonuclease McrA
VTPVLVDDEGRVIHVGRRRRQIPAPTRRALYLRDRRCQWAGCPMPPERCVPHHLVHWVDGGSDELGNLQLTCRRHHAMLHPENARFRVGTPETGDQLRQ